MMKRRLLPILVLFLQTLASGAEDTRPNIVILFSDDHRYDGVGALGHGQLKTPHLDRLIDAGTLFRKAYLQGANSGATCIPSRAQLLTGRGVFHIPNGVGRNFPESMTTFATAFSQAGYFTFKTGKSHTGKEASLRGFQGGEKLYGVVSGYYKPHFRMPYVDFREDGNYTKEDLYFVDGANHDIKLVPQDHLDHVGPHSSEIIGKAAADFISGYDRKAPFLLYVAFHAPHDTRNAPPGYHAMYDPDKIDLPINFKTLHPFDNGDLTIRDEKLAPFPRTLDDTRRQLADYYAIITHMDHQIGKILEALEARDLQGETLVVFLTDSGLGMGSQGLFGKQNLYDDAGIHIPLVLRGPGVPSGAVRDDLVYSFDLFPTLCEMAGVAIPPSVTGKSFAPAIVDEPGRNSREALFFAYKDTQRAIRDSRFKLIEYCVAGARHTQLFDLRHDPYETTNLVHHPEYQQPLKELRTRLLTHREEEREWGLAFWDAYLDSE